jgi:hypothetical protein
MFGGTNIAERLLKELTGITREETAPHSQSTKHSSHYWHAMPKIPFFVALEAKTAAKQGTHRNPLPLDW